MRSTCIVWSTCVREPSWIGYNLCREVCTGIVQGRQQMIVTHLDPIQIDKARFAPRRKYNRGVDLMMTIVSKALVAMYNSAVQQILY